MKVSSVTPVVVSSDRTTAVNSLTALVGAPIAEFPVPTAPLTVTIFTGLSLLSGTSDAIHPVRNLRATLFVDSLTEVVALLDRLGWQPGGSLGDASLLTADPDGNLYEFVQREELP